MPWDKLKELLNNPDDNSPYTMDSDTYSAGEKLGLNDLARSDLSSELQEQPVHTIAKVLRPVGELQDKYIGQPIRGALLSSLKGQSPITGAQESFGITGKEVSPEEVIEEGMPDASPLVKTAAHTGLVAGTDFIAPGALAHGISKFPGLAKSVLKSPLVSNEIGSVGSSVKPTVVPNEMGLYSKAEQVIMDKMKQDLLPEDVVKMLRNKGVKEEEIAISGIKDLFGKGTVSKEEVLSKIRSNTPKLEETVLSHEKTPITDPSDMPKSMKPLDVLEWRLLKNANPSDLDLVNGFIKDIRDGVFVPEDLRPWQRDLLNGVTDPKSLIYEVKKPPQYDNYTTPGGANYREVLIKNPGLGYKAPHFNDMSEDILAHYRTKDFKTPEGNKTLNAEEMQSDLHQEGRGKGYKKNVTEDEKRLNDIDKEMRKLEDKFKEYNDLLDRSYIADPTSSKHQKLLKELDNFDINDLNTRHDDLITERRLLYEQISRPPDAPFKDTYQDLILKRILKRAADEGYDQISWPTGKVQSARYPRGMPEEQAKQLAGMQQAYDVSAPNFVNKFAKKFGQKVELKPIDESNDLFHTLKLTPEMIKEIKEKGFPLFMLSGGLGTQLNPEDRAKLEALYKLQQ